LKLSAREHYGLAGRFFVENIVHDYDNAVRRARELKGEFRSSLVELRGGGIDGQVHRAGDHFSMFYAAGALASEFKILPFSHEQIQQAVKHAWSSWVHQRGGVGPMEDKAALDAVRSFISTQTHRFGFSYSGHESDYDATSNRAGVRILERGETFYAVLPAVWADEVCKGQNPVRVAQVLRDRGFLKTDSDGKLQSKVPVDKCRVRCYCVRAAILDQELE
jgi:hypothetical protein